MRKPRLEYMREWQRKFREKNRERLREEARSRYRANADEAKKRVNTYDEKNPDRYKARNAVKWAIESGRLIKKPCEVCGNLKVDAHHEDYSQPLTVRWLCRTHHKRVHSNYE